MGISVFSYRAAAALACVLIVFAGLSGCDNTIDPFALGDSQPFAIFGYLDTAADTQFVRISRTRSNESLLGELGDPPVVTITDVGTGETAAWKDSVIALADGSHVRAFFSTFDIQPSVSYRLDVVDDGAEPTQASTTLPGTNGVISGVPRPNRLGDLEQTVVWQDVRRGRDMRVHYRVRSLSTGADTTVVRDYGDAGGVTMDGWLISVALESDSRIVRSLVQSAYGDTAIALLDLSMSIEALSEEWGAAAEAANIENGMGFFASVARFRKSWSLDSTIIRAIGYHTP